MTDSQRIKKIIEELINRGEVKSENDLCVQLPYPSGNLSKIKNGERKFPAALKLLLNTKFGISIKYLSNDSTIMFEQPSKVHPQKGDETDDDPVATLKTLKESNRLYRDILHYLKKDNETITNANLVFSKIVDQVWEMGILNLDPNKVKT